MVGLRVDPRRAPLWPALPRGAREGRRADAGVAGVVPLCGAVQRGRKRASLEKGLFSISRAGETSRRTDRRSPALCAPPRHPTPPQLRFIVAQGTTGGRRGSGGWETDTRCSGRRCCSSSVWQPAKASSRCGQPVAAGGRKAPSDNPSSLLEGTCSNAGAVADHLLRLL